MIPGRVTVELMDAAEWLGGVDPAPLVAMLPDAHEVGMEFEEWCGWFDGMARACLLASSGPTVFAQTDRKVNGRWFSKFLAIASVAADLDRPLLWHRIALRRDAGKIDLHRPGYTNIVAFGPGRPGKPAPDVLPPGTRRWNNGVAENAAMMVATFMAGTGARRVLNPFCGVGTFMDALARQGIDVVGCDNDPDRAETSAAIQMELNGVVS